MLPNLRQTVALTVTLALATLGGLAAQALGMPLGLLMGSLLVTAVITALDLRIKGQGPVMPNRFRVVFVPVIGVAIGANFTPAVIAEAPGWWITMLGLLIYLPVAHALGYFLYRRVGKLDRATAYWGSVPGGFIESLAMGEAAGGHPAILSVMQFLRLVLTIIGVPLAFWWLTGAPVGSASGAHLGTGAEIALRDVLILTGAAVAGAFMGRALHLPGWQVTGPILLSGVAHAMEWTQAVPPDWMIGAVQVVMGAGLGVRFAGLRAGAVARAAALACVVAGLLMVLALGFALVFYRLVDQPLAAVFLAYAPGGLVEMSLVALSLHMSAIYVTAHHVARIVLSVLLAGIGNRLGNFKD
jgi:membrane AbrB-like protein